MTNCLATSPVSAAVEPVFKSTDDALRFAFRFSTQQHCSSELASLLRRSGGASERLVGPDGVVQAGMVRAEVDKLPPIQQALLIGRYGLAEIPCTCGRACCSGSVPNPEWTAAITTLTKSTIVEFSGRVTNFRLHREIIGNALLGIRVTDASLAARYGVHRQTVATHTAKIEGMLVGTRHQSGEFDRAFARIDALLREAGMVGDPAREIASSA
ncbi:DNA-binding protein [Burkholderia cenocepacia]|uniref:DNA-binding protein n=1 Tax=Burkholderia cenocepacia TaxID=95486 RepID=UPI002B251F42|nr:DNA-binding protein [Burkholderia cenocepacia]MEB2499551.1 DNA-binding protein [Burkholderia cenocepacia]MEB2557226.1 DNA-binding protein [Burkholderia cenocepacia]